METGADFGYYYWAFSRPADYFFRVMGRYRTS